MSQLALGHGLLQFFDVEHGCCALLTYPAAAGVQRLLIDCGHHVSSGWTPGAHLAGLGVRRLEHLIVTNLDEDHVSGLPDLLARRIQIDWLTWNSTCTPDVVKELKSTDGMGRGIDALIDLMPGYDITPATVRRPHESAFGLRYFRNPYPIFDDENNLSLVVLLTYRGVTFMFPGDLETSGFEYLLATQPLFGQALGSVDVLVAAHHGRSNGICDRMFEAFGCSPQLVVISDDAKKYATQETVDYYAGRATGIKGFRGGGTRKVLSTRYDGELRFSFIENQCIAC